MDSDRWILLMNSFPQLLLIGIVLLCGNNNFSLVTLPVEYDASNRVLAWLESKKCLHNKNMTGPRMR
jgi:Zn-dependent membrane protease YugP